MNPRTPATSGRAKWLALALGLAITAPATAAQLPCSELFRIERSERLFDNVRIEIVVLRTSSLALATDTLGAWTPIEGLAPGSEIAFRHRLMQDVRLSICRVARGDAPVSKASWESYVGAQRDSGPSVTILQNLDSSRDANVFTVTGAPTRDLLVSIPAAAGGEPNARHQVFAIGGEEVLVFTLTGPVSRIEAAAEDFRFFLARLERL